MGSETEPKEVEAYFLGQGDTDVVAELRPDAVLIGTNGGGSQAYAILPKAEARSLGEWLIEHTQEDAP